MQFPGSHWARRVANCPSGQGDSGNRATRYVRHRTDALRYLASTLLNDVPVPASAGVRQLTLEQVHEISTRAEQQSPTVRDKRGAFMRNTPPLVEALRSARLAIALAGVANRMHKYFFRKPNRLHCAERRSRTEAGWRNYHEGVTTCLLPAYPK